MGIWEDLQEGWQNFQNWLNSVGQVLNESYGQLGQGLMSGLMWLGSKIKDAFEWIHDGLVFVGTKLKEAYEILAEWVNTGLQWIGAGFSWLGANFYKFGHWMYNGIVASLKWTITTIKAVFNWFGKVLSSVWNGLCSLPATFAEGFNDFINDFALGLRSKLKMLIFVNTTIPIMGRQIESIPQRMSESKDMWGMLGAVVAPFITPIATMVLSEAMDNMIPKPSSKRITMFPGFNIPEVFTESLTMEMPEEMPDPEMVKETVPPVYETPGTIPYTMAGYKAEGDKGAGIGLQYEIILESINQAVKNNGIGIDYELILE